MSNEPLHERISQLERSVKRLRLAVVGLAFLLICAVAGGSLIAIPRTEESGGFWHWLPWVRAREAELRAREAEQRARLEAVRAEQAVEAQRQAAEPAKRAEEP